MAQPLDIILAFHNAFRNDIKVIDHAARQTARGKTGLSPQLERYRFFNEILIWHARGEEQGVFPQVETVAPLVTEAYARDHQGLDTASEALDYAVSTGDVLEMARASAAFKFHLDLHLAKEDAHLYRIMRERVPLPQQAQAIGIMSRSVPQERFPEAIGWLFSLINPDDQQNVMLVWQVAMAPEVFSHVKMLVQQATGDGWAELVRRIPTLA
jgi:hypothetical protein